MRNCRVHALLLSTHHCVVLRRATPSAPWWITTQHGLTFSYSHSQKFLGMRCVGVGGVHTFIFPPTTESLDTQRHVHKLGSPHMPHTCSPGWDPHGRWVPMPIRFYLVRTAIYRSDRSSQIRRPSNINVQPGRLLVVSAETWASKDLVACNTGSESWRKR